MHRVLKSILFLLVITALVSVSWWVFNHYIGWPGPKSFEFTNLDVLNLLNSMPFVSLDLSRDAVFYRAMHLEWMGLLVVWPLLLLFGARSLSDFPLWQRVLSFFVRLFFLLAIVGALVDIERIETSSEVAIVYAIDVSASMPDEAIKEAHAIVSQALTQVGPGVNVELVTYAGHAELIELPKSGVLAPFERHESAEDIAKSSTDIEAALRFAHALLPEEAVGRLVVMGDGNQTDGDALAQAVRMKAQGIRIDVKHLEIASKREVMLTGVDVRERNNLRVGRPFEVGVQVDATYAAVARIEFEQDGVVDPTKSKDLELIAGENYVSFTTQSDVPGPLKLGFRLTGLAEGDDYFVENNHIEDLLDIQGKPKVLYIEQSSASAAYLERALAGWGQSAGQNFDVEVRAATGMPESSREMSKYAVIILGDVPRVTNAGRANVTTSSMQALRDYVRKLGGGFIAIGGDQAFGLGGYESTPVETILPVEFKADLKKNNSSAAIALVIDKSGSMRERRNLDIAKEAAKASVAALKAQDRIMVIGFDDAPYMVVPATRAVNRYSINDKISRMQPSGGTNIRDALELTYLEMSLVSAKVKHVILLTDGRSSYTGIDALVREMARARITVSTVALADADTVLLSRIANLGKGRAYIVSDANSVPRIFVDETQRVTNNAVVEEPFTPKVVRSNDMTKGVAMDTLLGYVATKPKSGAQVFLSAPGGAPILAHWAYGTGKATVFTSDAKNRWASGWIRNSSNFAKFWAQVVRTTMKTEEETIFEMDARIDNDSGLISVDAIDENEVFLNGLDVFATIEAPGEAPYDLKLEQRAPGYYEARFPLTAFGTYAFRADLRQGDASLGTAQTTLSYPYPKEFAKAEANQAFLDAMAESTGGLIDPSFDEIKDPGDQLSRMYIAIWHYFLWLALALLLLDVFLRRVRFAR